MAKRGRKKRKVFYVVIWVLKNGGFSFLHPQTHEDSQRSLEGSVTHELQARRRIFVKTNHTAGASWRPVEFWACLHFWPLLGLKQASSSAQCEVVKTEALDEQCWKTRMCSGVCLLTGSAMADAWTLACCVLFHEDIKLDWLYLLKLLDMWKNLFTSNSFSQGS